MDNQRKKIMIISETFPPDVCGVADYVYILGESLSKYYNVHIVTRESTSRIVNTNEYLTIHQVIKSKAYVLGILQLVNLIKPDVVEMHLSYSGASQVNHNNLVSMFNSFLFKLFTKCKLICTVHELSSLHHSNSFIKKVYRRLRDYFNTRMYDYYFCVDRNYLTYLRTDRAEFLEHFSNFPTLCEKEKVVSKSFLFFGTINHHKAIGKLLKLFEELHNLDSEYHLIIAGGIDKQYSQEFYSLLGGYSKDFVEYVGKVDQNSLKSIMDRSGYAVFPFIISDKNSSVLAMMVNGLVVIAESVCDTEFHKYGNNFFDTDCLNSEYVNSVVNETTEKELIYKKNSELITHNINKRMRVYDSI